MLLEAEAREDFAVVLEHLDCIQVGLGLADQTVRSENDALAREVAEHVVNRDELDLPPESLKHVLFLGDELFVAVGDTDVVEKLGDSGVGLLEVLG